MSDGLVIPILVTVEGDQRLNKVEHGLNQLNSSLNKYISALEKADQAASKEAKSTENVAAQAGQAASKVEKLAGVIAGLNKGDSFTRLEQQFIKLYYETEKYNKEIQQALSLLKTKQALQTSEIDAITKLNLETIKLVAAQKAVSQSTRNDLAVLKSKEQLMNAIATARARENKDVKDLQVLLDSLNASYARSTAAQKEKLKGDLQEATFSQRQANTLAELDRLQKSYAQSQGALIAQAKERIKGLEQLATAATRLANEEARLSDLQKNNSFRIQTIAMIKEEIKGMETLATVIPKLINEESLLLAQQDPLARAKRQNILLLKLQQEHIDKLAVSEQALRNANEILANSMKGMVGSLTQQNSVLKVQKKAFEDAATFTARMQAKSEELARTLEYLRSTQGKQQVITEAQVKAERKLILIREEFLNKTRQLQAALNDITQQDRQDQATLSVRQRLLQRNAELMALNSVEARRLAADNARLERSLRHSSAALRDFGINGGLATQMAAALRSSLAGLSVTFGMYTSGTILAALATYTLVRNLKDAVTVGAEFEDKMARVGAIASRDLFGSQAYEQDLEALKQRALNIAATTRFTALEVTEAMKELALAGLSTEQVIVAAPAALNLAAIGAIDFGQAADIATNIMMGFQLEAEDLTRVVDIMAVAVTRSNQNVQQLGNAMSYAAPIASSFGVDLEFVSAATMVLANAGIKASRAGTTLRRSLTGILTPTTRGQKAFAKLGIEVDALGEGIEGLESLDTPIAGLFDSAETGTEKLIERLKALHMATNGAKTNIRELVDVVGLWAAPGTIQLLMSMNKGLNQSLLEQYGIIKKTTNAAEDMRLKMQDSLKGSWDYLQGALQAVRIQVFDQVAEQMRNLVDRVHLVLQALAENKEAIKDTIQALKDFGQTLLRVIALFLAFKLAMSGWAFIKGASVLLLGFHVALGNVYRGLVAVGTGAASAVAGITLAGARAKIAAAGMAALGASLGWISTIFIGGYLVYELGKFVAGFLKLGDTAKSVKQAYTSLTEGTAEAIQKYHDRFDSLIGGELQGLYNQKKAHEDQIEALARKGGIQNDNLAKVKEEEAELTKVNEKIAESEQFLRKYGDTMLRIRWTEEQLNSTRQQSERERLQKEIERTKLQIGAYRENSEDPLQGNASRVKKLSEELKVLESESAKIEKVTQIGAMKIEEIEALEAALRGGTKGIQEAVRIRDETLRAQLTEIRDDIELKAKQHEVLGEVLKTLTLNGLAESVAPVQAVYDDLGASLEHLHLAASQAETSIGVIDKVLQASPTYALDSIEEFTEAVYKADGSLRTLRESMNKSESQLLEEEASKTKAHMERLNAQFNSQLEQFNALRKTIIQLRDEGNEDAVNALMSVVGGIYAEMVGAMSAVFDSTEDAIEAQNKFNKLLDDTRAEYDEVFAKTLEWREKTEELHTLLRSTGDLETHATYLGVLVKKIVEFDDATGALTDNSRKFIEQAISMTEEMIRQENAIIEAKWAWVEYMDVMGIALSSAQMEAFVRSLDAADQRILDAQTRLEVLRKALSMRGDVKPTSPDRSSNKDAEDAQRRLNSLLSEYQKLLTAAGQSLTALALSRAMELNEAEDQERAIIALRHAYEDLERARELALRNRALSTTMRGELIEAEGLVERMGKMRADGTLSSFFEGFDSENLTSRIDGIIDTTGKGIAGLFDELGRYATTAGQTITDAFDQIIELTGTATWQIHAGLSSFAGTRGPGGVGPSGIKMPEGALKGVDTALAGLIAQFRSAASAAGHDITITSGHRTRSEQAALYAAQGHRVSTARPGTSKHELGLAVDLGGNAAAQQWMEQNADKYGLWMYKGKGYKDHLHFELLALRKGLSSVGKAATDAVRPVETVASKLEGVARIPDYVAPDSSLPLATQAMQSVQKRRAQLSEITALRKEISGRQGTEGFGEADLARIAQFEETAKDIQTKLQQDLVLYDKLALDQVEKHGRLLDVLELSEAERISLGDAYGTLDAQMRKYNKTLIDVTRLEAEGLLTGNQKTKILKSEALAIIATQGEMKAYYASLVEGMQTFEGVAVDSLDHIRETLIDSFVSGEFEAKAFFDFFKRKLAEFAVNTIFVNIVGVLGGVVGNAAGSALSAAFGGGSAAGRTPVGGATGTLAGGQQKLGGSFAGLSSWFGGYSIGKEAGSGLIRMGLKAGMPASKGLLNAGAGLATTPNWAYGAGSLLGGLAGTYAFGNKGYSGLGASIGSTGGSFAGSAIAGMMGVTGPIGLAIAAVVGGLLGGLGGGGLGSLFGGAKQKTPMIHMDVSGGALRSTYSRGWKGDTAATNKAIEDANKMLQDVAKQLGPGAQNTLKNLNVMGETQYTGENVDAWLKKTMADAVFRMVNTVKTERVAKQLTNRQLYDDIIDEAIQAAGDDPDALVASLDAARELFDAIRTASSNVFNPATDAFIKNSEAASDLLWTLMNDTKLAGEAMMDSLSRVVNAIQVANDAFWLMGDNSERIDPAKRLAQGQKLIDEAGGYDKLMQGMTTYYENFYSEEERTQRALEQSKKQVGSVFDELGTAVPKTRDEFRKLVDALDPLNENDQKKFVKLMEVSGALDAIFDAADKDWQGVTDAITTWIKETKKLLISDTQSEQQYRALFGKAKGGDGKAATELPEAASAYLDFARKTSRTEADYKRTVGRVLDEMTQIQKQAAAKEMLQLTEQGNATANATLEVTQAAAANAQGHYAAVGQYHAQQIATLNANTKEVVGKLSDLSATTRSVLGYTGADDPNWNQTFGRGFASGGIASGPKSGYAALLHGTEAVVPLENGSIPVTILGGLATGGSDRLLREILARSNQPSQVRIVSSGPTSVGPVQAFASTSIDDSPAQAPTVHVSGLSFEAMIEELQGLRTEVVTLREEQRMQHHASYREQRDTADVMKKWDALGMPEGAAQ